MTIAEILEQLISQKGSDLHFLVGKPPTLRVQGELSPLSGYPVLNEKDVEDLLFSLLTPEQKNLLLTSREIDFSFSLGKTARFRANLFFEKGYLAAALRLIPLQIPTIDALNLPPFCHRLTELPQGLVLVAGPASQGKSTTLAAMINEINQTRSVSVITIEDPIEYIYPEGKSLVVQREMHLDTHSWQVALRSALREDPEVVMVGEMRDYETIASTITVAETGHLVFTTLHTNSAAQTIDRIIDVFPQEQQQQVRTQLASALEAILSQRLIPTIDGLRVPAVEVLLATHAVRGLVREGKSHLLDNVIQTSGDLGMQSLEHSLAGWIKAGRITFDEAKKHTAKPDELGRLLHRFKT